MHLLTDGLVKIADHKGPGKLLLTERSLFVLGSNTGAASIGGAVGGLVGALIGHFIDKHKGKKNAPAHLDDPEIVELGEKVRHQLLSTELLAKLPLKPSLSVEPTRLGFMFTAGSTVVKFDGWAHKKKIAQFLDNHGVHVNAG